MSTFVDNLFSPLGKEYCAYFYWLTVIAFIFLLLALFDVVTKLLKGRVSIVESLLKLLAPTLAYFVNRLLYSMCVN
jgi:hypothetical protein